jgi:hypothetical protein
MKLEDLLEYFCFLLLFLKSIQVLNSSISAYVVTTSYPLKGRLDKNHGLLYSTQKLESACVETV